jgi:7-carboxy-7-deazaguanine synthase
MSTKIRHKETLLIKETFQSIQGEGPFSGQPAFFVRLAGCNLSCPYCDTNHTTDAKTIGIGSLVAEILHKCFPNDLVVITGGEPFNQDITKFVKLLLAYDYRIQIETNGTKFLQAFPYDRVTIVCSPKTLEVNPDLIPHVDAYKYVIKGAEYCTKNGMPINAIGNIVEPHVFMFPENFDISRVYIQPLDEKAKYKNCRNTAEAINICLKFGYTLCLQIHKIIGKD